MGNKFCTKALHLFIGTHFYLYYNTVKAIHPTDITSIPYTTGKLVIDVIQNEKDKLIWRGCSMTPVKSDFTKWDFIQIVDDLFERYPVDKRNRIGRQVKLKGRFLVRMRSLYLKNRELKIFLMQLRNHIIL